MHQNTRNGLFEWLLAGFPSGQMLIFYFRFWNFLPCKDDTLHWWGWNFVVDSSMPYFTLINSGVRVWVPTKLNFTKFGNINAHRAYPLSSSDEIFRVCWVVPWAINIFRSSIPNPSPSRLELRCVRPSIRTYVHKKFFRFPSNLVCG